MNDEQRLLTRDELYERIPYREAFESLQAIVSTCNVQLITDAITPPGANIPEHISAKDMLRELCLESYHARYPSADLTGEHYRTLEHELELITELELQEFFLVVREVMIHARMRGIRCSGRGSAANSMVAYLLGITNVDPIKHRLVFERFLHRGKAGTPDIDVDFDSDRRAEVIRWIEQRFGTSHTAMTANIIRYRARMAIRDVAKVLGWPHEMVTTITRQVPGFPSSALLSYKNEIASYIGDSPLLQVLLVMAERLLDVPRHLGQHSGGMLLSSVPLPERTPVQRSANGVIVAQFDKDDAEHIGLVKLDVLGLRMLACISECLELIYQCTGDVIEIDNLTLDDPAVYDMICRGETLGVFQIESQGQMHLLAQHQPRVFTDIVVEVALFRPGPLQGKTLNPYVRRKRGTERTVYLHPLMEPILEDTCGVIVFQEQQLEITHVLGNMSLKEAEEFRSIISKNRNRNSIEAMKRKFINGALGMGIDIETAHSICEQLAHFTGFGFCRSHAAAFATIVYQSAWLKYYHPAAYMAAFMQHRPGFYNLTTLEQEARRLGARIQLPDINTSGARYAIMDSSSGYIIQKPLRTICSEQDAKHIVWTRLMGKFTSVDDAVQRLNLDRNVFDALAISGAFDSLSGNSRKALWEVGVAVRRKKALEQQPSLFDLPLVTEDDIPVLPAITVQERLVYDYRTHGAARIHPMALYRRHVQSYDVYPIERCMHVNNTTVVIAGIVILRQSPPTANGFLFVTLEDETGFIQCVISPANREKYHTVLKQPTLIVKGRLNGVNNWRGLVLEEAYALQGMIGGYYGHLSMYSGLDRMELAAVK